MNVNVQVQLSPDQVAPGSANDIAQQIMELFNLNAEKDTVNVIINDQGVAGAMAMPIAPPTGPPVELPPPESELPAPVPESE